MFKQQSCCYVAVLHISILSVQPPQYAARFRLPHSCVTHMSLHEQPQTHFLSGSAADRHRSDKLLVYMVAKEDARTKPGHEFVP